MTKNGLQILLYLRRIVSHLKRKEEKKKLKFTETHQSLLKSSQFQLKGSSYSNISLEYYIYQCLCLR